MKFTIHDLSAFSTFQLRCQNLWWIFNKHKYNCLKYLFSLSLTKGIIKTTANVQNTTLQPSYRLQIVAIDSYIDKLISDPVEVFIRLSHKPTIQITDTIIGAYQFETTVLLQDFSHLREVETLEISVQQYHPLNSYCK